MCVAHMWPGLCHAVRVLVSGLLQASYPCQPLIVSAIACVATFILVMSKEGRPAPIMALSNSSSGTLSS